MRGEHRTRHRADGAGRGGSGRRRGRQRCRSRRSTPAPSRPSSVTVQTQSRARRPTSSCTENGVPARNLSPVDPGAPAAIALVIDTSNSMAGQKLHGRDRTPPPASSARRRTATCWASTASTRPAVHGRADSSPDRTEIVTASASWHRRRSRAPPSTAPSLAAEDLAHSAGPEAGAWSCSRTAPRSRHRDSSTMPLAAASRAGVIVYPIGIATDAAAPRRRSTRSRGDRRHRSTATDSSALASVYDAISDELGTHLHLPVPERRRRPARRSSSSVSAPGFGSVSQTLKAPGTFVAAPERLGRPESARQRRRPSACRRRWSACSCCWRWSLVLSAKAERDPAQADRPVHRRQEARPGRGWTTAIRPSIADAAPAVHRDRADHRLDELLEADVRRRSSRPTCRCARPSCSTSRSAPACCSA